MIRQPPRSTLFYTTLFRSRLPNRKSRNADPRYSLRNSADAAPAGHRVQYGGGHTARRAAVVQRGPGVPHPARVPRSEEHTSELQSQSNLVCRLLLEKKNTT